MKFLKRIGVFVAAIFGVYKAEDALDVAIEKLVTPDVQALLEQAIADLFNTQLSGKERKAKAKEALKDAEAGIKENAAKAGEQALSRAIDLIVNREKLKGVEDARKANSDDYI